MKQIIKVYFSFILLVIMLFINLCTFLVPFLYIDNVLFVILYLVILYPLVMLGIYKIEIVLYNKI